jgi:phosphate ABC transporter phosphate-binding protein
MQNRLKSAGGRASKVACCVALALVAICVHAQTAHDLSQVKKVFVASLSGGNGAAELHESLVKQLRKSGKFEVVATPNQADAVIRGKGQLWVTGYIATSPRSPSTNRQAVFEGFLSVEVVGADNAVLWSYLVTPSKFSWGSIADNLSDNLVREMAAARNNPGPPPNQAVTPTRLHGAGSTFAAPLYEKWFESFQQQHLGIRVSYDAVGSGLGTQLLSQDKVDFAASDVPQSDQGPSQSAAGFRRIASVLGGVVPIYNLKGLTQNLKFTPEALAGIYLGKITKWNDPIIKGVNKSARLPDADIVVIHRSDGSGTTYAWSDYLSKISADWKNTVGADISLKWPVGTGVERNEGVAATVQRTPNSIGYVELVYAIQHQLSYGAIRNAAGEYIRANLESVTAAAVSAIKGNPVSPSSITNASGKGAYPITTFTFFLLPQRVSDSQKKAALIELLRWVLTSGQKESSALGYAPLPRELANRQLEALDSIK